jgi:hypothetical protein
MIDDDLRTVRKFKVVITINIWSHWLLVSVTAIHSLVNSELNVNFLESIERTQLNSYGKDLVTDSSLIH